MTDNKNKSSGDEFSPVKSYILLGCSIFFTLVSAYWIYREIQDVFFYSLQQRIQSIAQTSAGFIEESDLDKITNRKTIGSPEFVKVTKALQLIKLQNPHVKFVYIFRKTNDPNHMKYVADADSMHPNIPIDLNGDGVIDDADALNHPGEDYDATDYPYFVENAFKRAFADQELEESQWGWTLDAYAPIQAVSGEPNYLIGVDVDVSEFIRQTNLAFIPFALFVFVLIISSIVLTVALVRMWGSRVQILKELDRQKDELLSIVSHQLAAPVTSIKWYLELLLDGDTGKLTDDQTTTLKSMQSISVDLADLVSMILDVSRIQLGRMRVDPQPLDLKAFFTEILDVIDPKAKEKPVNFKVEMPEALPTVLLDKRLTRMTVENLLTNAVKYTPKDGNVTFKVELRPDNTMYIEVRDTGCGIPKQDQDKIFGKQFRASNVRNTIDGNGFGLYVAKGAIESQDGKIWFESEEGKGTAFYIELPLKFAK